MPTLAPVQITAAPHRLSADLTSGKSYVIQCIGVQDALYCNSSVDPSTVDIGWRICQPYEFFNSGKIDDTANALWVKAAYDKAQLSVGEAP